MLFERLHSRFENEDNVLTSLLITRMCLSVEQLHRTIRNHGRIEGRNLNITSILRILNLNLTYPDSLWSLGWKHF